MTALEVREKAASLVAAHAARLGMDPYAAEMLIATIRAIPIADEEGGKDGRR